MKGLNKDVLTFAILLVAGYSLYAQPFGTTLMGFGVAAIVFALTKCQEAALAVLVVPILLNYFKQKPEPMGIEAFQARDPVSVQARLEDIKMGPPLSPKVENITGVLESASILNNTPLQGSQEGSPGASIPAGVKSRVLIYPPAEDTIPASEVQYLNPKENPYLHSGQDRLAEEVSLAQKGTDLYAEDAADNIAGVSMGAGPAF